MLIVTKFGGTSVGDADAIKRAASIITDLAKDSRVIVVVSAMAGVSDSLLDMVSGEKKDPAEIDSFIKSLGNKHLEAVDQSEIPDASNVTEKINKLLDNLRKDLEHLYSGSSETHEKYTILGYGEKLSATILTAVINARRPASCHFGDDNLIITDNYFRDASPIMPETEPAIRGTLIPVLENDVIPVITGYIGTTRDGRTTTLGRGSSDYIASVIGAVLDADEIQIWTDVDGVLTADPGIVPDARLLDRISYMEANELAYYGAKVLHPNTISPAVMKNIPIRIKNSTNPDSPGTLITDKVEVTPALPTAITSKKDVILIDVNSAAMVDAFGYLSRIFDVFRKFNVSVDMVSTTEISVSVTIDKFYSGKLEPVIEELGKIARVRVMKDKALICVIGEGLESAAGLTGRVFSAMGEMGVNIYCISMGALEMNVSFVVDLEVADDVIRTLHEMFFSKSD